MPIGSPSVHEVGCFGKHAYSSFTTAEGIITRNLERDRRAGKTVKRAGLQPYHCQRCGAWHVGNSTLRRQRSLREGEA